MRQFLLLLMLPHLLLSPAAGWAHGHEEGQPAGPPNRPHVHLGLSAHGHRHDPTEPDEAGPFTTQDDHDSDAVYLPPFDVTAAERGPAGDVPTLDLAAPASAVVIDRPAAPPPRSAWPRPPSPPPHPLYLRLRALLI